MAEVLVEFTDPVVLDGVAYMARACGARGTDGLWQGWIEFSPIDGDPPLRSPRETTQPNRDDTMYWATGLSGVYLEGALRRTLNASRAAVQDRPPARPAFDEPAPAGGVRPPDADRTGSGHAVLDPFAIYRKGEQLLRQQLGALSAWHLVNIVEAHGLSRLDPVQLNAMGEPELVELIVLAVGQRNGRPEAARRSHSARRPRVSARQRTSARR
jgi:hypothetical protein